MSTIDTTALADEAGLPASGPCGCCGGPDARHRLVDAVRERDAAGDTTAGLARDYGLTAWQVGVLTRGAHYHGARLGYAVGLVVACVLLGGCVASEVRRTTAQWRTAWETYDAASVAAPGVGGDAHDRLRVELEASLAAVESAAE